jgi:hypothetical protein
VNATIRANIAHLLKANPQRASELATLLRQRQFKPEFVWKNLSLISCWTKAAAAFYLKDFPQYYGSIPVCDITYGASEGRGTVCIAPDKQALALRSHFFEFVPEDEIESPNPRALVADELEEGQSYYILFTTSGGLFRYNINDIVKVVGWHNKTPLLEFLHKGGNISSFTGEKITESQVTDATSALLKQTGTKARFFSVVPSFRPEPHYQLWLELESDPSDLSTFTKLTESEFDKQLGLCNIEYRTKRDSQRLAPPVVRLLRPGSYENLRRTLVSQGVPDAQIKVSHLNPKDNVRDALEQSLLVPTK